MSLKWSASKEEYYLATLIAQRATKTFGTTSSTVQDVMMDIIATHVNGCPLDLEGLLTATPFDFSHDVNGISDHIDRETGKLKDFFTPRYTGS